MVHVPRVLNDTMMFPTRTCLVVFESVFFLGRIL
jgi:hypothetical protein